jgi:hypothetical protein
MEKSTHANPGNPITIGNGGIPSGKGIRMFGASLGLLILGSLAHPASAATFDEQRKTVAASIETQSEKAIISLLQAGIKEGKSTQAIAE